MSFAADDSEAIRRRLEEIEAEKKLALTGSTIEQPKQGVPAIDSVYGDYAMGFQPWGFELTEQKLTAALKAAFP